MSKESESTFLKWSEIVAECERSDMSESAWCREHDIPKPTYFKWKRKIKEAQLPLHAPLSQVVFTTEARNKYIKIAKELLYSENVVTALRNAKDEIECEKILRAARKGMYE